jgi:hypothetical protein
MRLFERDGKIYWSVPGFEMQVQPGVNYGLTTLKTDKGYAVYNFGRLLYRSAQVGQQE